MAQTTGIKSNIHDEPIRGHRYGKKLTNDDYGTVAFLINKGERIKPLASSSSSSSAPQLTKEDIQANYINTLVNQITSQYLLQSQQ